MGKGGKTKQVPGAVPKWKGKATIVNVEGNGKGRDGIVTLRATVKAEMSIAAAMYHLYEAYIAVGPEACDAMDWEECFKKYFVRKDGEDYGEDYGKDEDYGPAYASMASAPIAERKETDGRDHGGAPPT